MKRLSLKKIGVLLCALLLAFIVGCQSVGGLNLNEMILKQIDVSKQEQSQLLELEFDLNEQLLAEEDPELVSVVHAFQKVSLNITHSKVDGKGNQWMTGVFSFGKGNIPFTLHSDSKALRFDIEGAKRPLIIEASHKSSVFGIGSAGNESSQQAIIESVRQLVKKVASYFVKNLPNPQVLSVDRVSSPVNGISTNLTKVHAELNGEQLGGLIPVYFDNLVKDKEGLETMLRNVLQWVKELPPEIKDAFGETMMPDVDIDVDAVIEEVLSKLYPMLEEAKKQLETTRNEDDWKEAFDKGVKMAADWYVDDSLHLRKSLMEIQIEPAAFSQDDSPVRSIKIRNSSEMWNVNGDVVVPAVNVPRNALNVDDLVMLQPYQVLRLFDESSVLYAILKNDFKLNQQSFELSTEWGIPFYVDSKDVTYVPIRATMQEFGVRLNVPSTKGQIRFYDQGTEQAFVFLTGSVKATVNGKSVSLKHKVINDGHFTYISADDLFGLLHAKYEITKLKNGELVMEVTRDL